MEIYYVTQVLSNSNVFFGDMTYLQELLSLSGVIVQKIIDIVSEEPLQVSGNLVPEETLSLQSAYPLPT